MLIGVTRGGLVEALHDISVSAVDAGGAVLFETGDQERPFFARSSLKPFQANVARSMGARLRDETLAIACASHVGRPDQLRLVDLVLTEHGLSVTDLATPPDRPSSVEALLDLEPGTPRSPRFHNCSGKHAGLLAACRVAGMPTAGYTERTHPAQALIETRLREVCGPAPAEPGIDGCGFPTHAVSVTTLARLFAHIASDPAFGPERDAILAHPDTIGDPLRTDSLLARTVGLPSKNGAEACLGIAVPQLGLGIGLKAWDGNPRALGVAAAVALERLGVDSGSALETVAPVLGGGRPVGRLEVLTTDRR